jgi:geranylgeranyl pyrophosphate synthase
LPLIRALQSFHAAERAHWIQAIEHPTSDTIEQLRDRIDATDASQYTLEFARNIVHQAIDGLHALATSADRADSPALQALIRLAHASIARAG